MNPMPTFQYEARDQQGNRVSGTVDAAEQKEAVKQLHASGYYVTGVKAQATALPGPARVAEKPGRPIDKGGGPLLGVGPRDLSIFFRDLHQMLHAGISLAKGFELMSKNHGNASLRRICHDIEPRIAHGEQLSAQLRKYPNVFTPLMLGLVTAGEEGGFLDRSCQQIARYLDQEHEVRQRLRAETMYPKLVIVMAVIVSAIVPAAPALTTGGFGPAFFRELFKTLGMLAIPAGLLGGAWLAIKTRAFGPGMTKLVDDAKLLIPGIGTINRKIALAHFCRALAALYSAGMGFGRALELAAAASGNEAISQFVQSRIPQVERGGRLSDLMRESRYFPPIVLSMLSVGEETGDIDGALNKVAEYYELEAETGLKMMTKIIGVGALLLVGLLVAKNIIGFYTGYFDNIMKLAE